MDQEQKLLDLMDHFSVAMLVTTSSLGQPSCRPMWIAEKTESGEVWFATDRASGKVHEAAAGSGAAVTMQGDNRFISLEGSIELVDDQEKVKQLWTSFWKVWFPEGPEDGSIVLLKFVPRTGEYWDNSGMEGWKYLVRAGVAYLTGSRPGTDASINAEVDMNHAARRVHV